MTEGMHVLAALNASLLLQLVGLLVAIYADKYIEKKYRVVLFFNVILILLIIILGQYESYTGYVQSLYMARNITSVILYCMRPVVIVLFMMILSDDKKPWILVGINTVIFVIGFFNGITFTITQENRFVRGPLGFTAHVISGILLAWHAYIAFKKYNESQKRVALMPVFITGTIIFGVIMDYVSGADLPISYLTVTVVTSCLFYYIWLHIMYVREHDRVVEAEKKIAIMMSQIQPHFMYNTLSTIQALCLKDPKKAFSTAEKFGTYLRNNIGSLNKQDLISFEEELEHTKVYAEIENIRFPNIKIEYNIEDKDYKLPALTLQPIVENAIRHGVRIRKEGLIVITSKLEDNYHVLIIEDNGKGFDVEKVKHESEGHIGITTIKDRLNNLCGGILEVHSTIDEGSTIVIKIPVGEKQDETDMR
ncbi:sensor histidine kinase [Butyrivibrio sp. NC2002]|uniref:sensor histidine kinase n=1 Tax=Butyrivibrio sp. NC2002 TaxID=1410610 RepID=UPI00068ADCFC|nr:histidine kinase [Butyrivibrio sp. NC2002]